MQVSEFRVGRDTWGTGWESHNFGNSLAARPTGGGWQPSPEPTWNTGWNSPLPSWAVHSGGRHWLQLDWNSQWSNTAAGSSWNTGSGNAGHCHAHRAICDAVLGGRHAGPDRGWTNDRSSVWSSGNSRNGGHGRQPCDPASLLRGENGGTVIYIHMDGQPVRVVADPRRNPDRPTTPTAPDTPPTDGVNPPPVDPPPADPAPVQPPAVDPSPQPDPPPANGVVTALGGRATIRAADNLSPEEAATAIEQTRVALENAYANSPTFRNAIDNARVGQDGPSGTPETFNVVVGRGPYAFPGMDAPIDGSFASLENQSGEEFVYIDLNQADIINQQLAGRSGFNPNGVARLTRHEFGHAAGNLEDGNIGEAGPNQTFSAQTSFEVGDNPTDVAYTYGTALG